MKRALDTEWSDPGAKDEALNTLVQQLNSLNAWLRKKLPEELEKPPLKEHLDTLAQIRTPNAVPISASDLVHVQQKRYHCGPPDSMAPAMANQRGSAIPVVGPRSEESSSIDSSARWRCSNDPSNERVSSSLLRRRLERDRSGDGTGR